MNVTRYAESPFSIPCPHRGSVAVYQPNETRTCQTNASQVALDLAGSGPEADSGTLIGKCQCTNNHCQEHTHFVGPYGTMADDSQEPPAYNRAFVIKYFFPPVPLLKIPPGTPEKITALLKRSFAPAFMDQAASGHLLRSAVEELLTEHRVPRFITSAKGKRVRLSLHSRIDRLPQRLLLQKDALLAMKWIGNAASHETLAVEDLKLAYQIVESLLNNLYGTSHREMANAIKRINRRKRP